MMLYKYPVFGVGGNHDYPESAYRAIMGFTRWTRAINNELLITGIYITPYDTENIITWEETLLLENAVKNYSHLPVNIIVTHFPVLQYQGELTTRCDDEDF